MKLYNNVKRIAKERKVPIYKIEDKAELSRGSICKWNKVNPTLKNVAKVCEILGVGVEEVLKDAD